MANCARRRCTGSPTRPSPSRPGCSTTTLQSYEDIAQAFVDGKPVGNLTRDEVLDNITLTWLTNTGVSSGRLYWENTLGFFDVKGVTVPAAVSVFPQRALPGAAELGRAGLPQPHLLQRGRRGQPLRGLAGAGAVHAPRSARRSGSLSS